MSKSLKTLKNILPFLWTKKENIRVLLLLSFSLIFLSVGLNLSIPLVLKEIVSKLSASNNSMNYEFSLLLASYGIIWTLSQIIQQVRQIILARPLERGLRLFCFNLFDHLHSLPMKFHLDRKMGEITNALERAQNAFPDIFLGLFLFFIPTILEIFFASLILFYYYGIFYVVLMCFISFGFFVFTVYATEWASSFQDLSNEQQSCTNSNIVDSLLNFANIKYFNNKNHELLKCEKLLKKREHFLIKSISSMEYVRIGQNFIIGMGVVLVTYMAGKQTFLKTYNISDFILINGYILQFSSPLAYAGFIIRDVRRGLNDLASVMKIYNTRCLPSSHYNAIHAINELKDIKFKNVSFGYEASRLVLKDVSFYLHAKKKLGIVGATGSGKSTISGLLFKLYEVNSGEILINDQNIQQLKLESLYDHLGIVPQDITLFNTTIYENILFGRPTASKKEVEETIALACLGSFLKELPNHYNTVVGERGLKLSGGEKQRIAIARALLKKPSLYIFDEATSSLDLSTEQTILQNIEPIMQESASIIIAHRLSAVRNAEEILVLHNGEIRERGTHASLIEQQGRYFSLWEAQKEAYKNPSLPLVV